MLAEHLLRQMYHEGRQRWPEVELSFAVFERHCAKLSVDDGAAVMPHAAGLFLCCACLANDRRAIAVFEREALRVAEAAIVRISKDPEFVRETLQELSMKLLVGPNARLAEYSGRGSLEAWLKVVATRAALDRCRRDRTVSEREAELGTVDAVELLGPESHLTQRRYANDFQRALVRAFSTLSARERNLLRMHVVGHCSIDQIGRAYDVHRATAARWLDRARTRVLASLRSEFTSGGARLSESEFRSVARLVGNDLSLGFSEESAALASRLVGSVSESSRSSNA